MSSSEPLVSQIMPAWKPRKDWFLDAVASALGQRDCSHELVVVDDGSPEPVEHLLAEIADPRLRVLRVEHGGPSHARNAGVAAARGRLIRFIDADDTYEPHSTARLAALVGEHDDVIAYGATVFCDEHLRPVWTMSSRLEGVVVEDAVLARFPARIQSFLFPRHIVDAAGGWDPTFPVCGDLDFIVRALEHARVRSDPGVATYYRKHGGSVSADIVRGDQGGWRVVESYFERHPERRPALERRAAAARHSTAARAYAARGMAGASLRRAAKALRLSPAVLAAEVAHALPALGGHLRRAVRRRPTLESSAE